jgi:hypothetical protein
MASAAGKHLRRADPYTDTDVIDERAPRFNQAVIGTLAALAALFGWPLLWALLALQLLVGLTLGRRWCLPCLAYFELVQPRIGEGRLEDSRAPRLANMIGVAFLGAGALAWWAGAGALATVLGSIVAVLALLAAITGICAGCELYRLIARLRGISPRHHDRIDPTDLGEVAGSDAVIQFTHPLCSDCREWSERLRAGSAPLVEVDVAARPELAHKYGIAIVPTVFRVAGDGEVIERLA